MTGRGSTPAPHVPVLLDEVIGALAIQPGEAAVDGTFGAGGYTRAMLQVGAGRVIAFDRDPDAIEAGRSLVPNANLTLIEERSIWLNRSSIRVRLAFGTSDLPASIASGSRSKAITRPAPT